MARKRGLTQNKRREFVEEAERILADSGANELCVPFGRAAFRIGYPREPVTHKAGSLKLCFLSTGEVTGTVTISLHPRKGCTLQKAYECLLKYFDSKKKKPKPKQTSQQTPQASAAIQSPLEDSMIHESLPDPELDLIEFLLGDEAGNMRLLQDDNLKLDLDQIKELLGYPFTFFNAFLRRWIKMSIITQTSDDVYKFCPEVARVLHNRLRPPPVCEPEPVPAHNNVVQMRPARELAELRRKVDEQERLLKELEAAKVKSREIALALSRRVSSNSSALTEARQEHDDRETVVVRLKSELAAAQRVLEEKAARLEKSASHLTQNEKALKAAELNAKKSDDAYAAAMTELEVLKKRLMSEPAKGAVERLLESGLSREAIRAALDSMG